MRVYAYRFYPQGLPQSSHQLRTMKVLRTSYLLAVIFIGTHAQQLENITRIVSYPGLSDGCLDALNTTVATCPFFLSSVSIENPRLNSDQLAALCTPSCHSALTSVRTTIKEGCSAANDTIEFDSVVYPGNIHQATI